VRILTSRSLLRAGLAVPGVALAVLTAASIPAAAATGHAAAPQAALTWHSLTLANGWKSASTAKLNTGKPAWAIRDGVVYLRGAVTDTVTGTSLFGQLPVAARPSRDLCIGVYTASDSTGDLFIGSDGSLEAYNGEATTFTSLATVSFPVASTKWHAFKLIADWRSGASRFRTGAPSHAVVSGVVFLAGSMYQSSAGTVGLWTDVPAAAQPRHVLEIKAYMLNGAAGAGGHDHTRPGQQQPIQHRPGVHLARRHLLPAQLLSPAPEPCSRLSCLGLAGPHAAR
jgi:hypothetical protein